MCHGPHGETARSFAAMWRAAAPAASAEHPPSSSSSSAAAASSSAAAVGTAAAGPGVEKALAEIRARVAAANTAPPEKPAGKPPKKAKGAKGASTLCVGDAVEAHFGVLEAEQWWPAVVTKVWASGEMDVRYDDGDVELKKPASRVRALSTFDSRTAAR